MAIKTTLVPPPNKAKEIDWSNRQIVHKVNNPDLVILTTRKHSEKTFEGIVLTNETYAVGFLKSDWFKENFTPITTPITITFENE